MSDRITPQPPSSLPADQKAAYDHASSVASSIFGPNGKPFLYQDPSTSAFLGPFAPLLATPTLVEPYLALVVAMGKLNSLPRNVREVAILATGSQYQAGYELYAHARVAKEKTDLSEGQIEQVCKGVKPSGEEKLDEKCEVGFDVALELSHGRGKLSKENWERAMGAFGEEGTMALVHYVAAYAYTCILLNAVDASVPE